MTHKLAPVLSFLGKQSLLPDKQACLKGLIAGNVAGNVINSPSLVSCNMLSGEG